MVSNKSSLSYLKALSIGKHCDLENPCEDGDECDLVNSTCVPEGSETYYEDIERMKYKGKSFVGKKGKMPKEESSSSEEEKEEKEEKPKSKSKPKPKSPEKVDEEDVDLDFLDHPDEDLSALQKALIECLMPSTKGSARQKK